MVQSADQLPKVTMGEVEETDGFCFFNYSNWTHVISSFY